MAREIIIEHGRFGDQVFVKKHKKHHHHHHHHDGGHHNGPTWEEYERLRETNEALCRERDCLKAELEQARATIARQDAEERRIVGENHRLADQNHRLRHEVEELRRAGGGWDEQLRTLRHKLTRALNDNDLLRIRDAELEDRVRTAETKASKAETYANRLLQQVERLKAKLEHKDRLVLRLEEDNGHLRDKLEYYETAPLSGRRPWRC